MREDVAYIAAANNIINIGTKYASQLVIDAVEMRSRLHLHGAKEILETYQIEAIAKLFGRIATRWPDGPRASDLRTMAETYTRSAAGILHVISDVAEDQLREAAEEFFALRDDLLTASASVSSFEEWSGVQNWEAVLTDVVMQVDLIERHIHRRSCQSLAKQQDETFATWEAIMAAAWETAMVTEQWIQDEELMSAIKKWRSAPQGKRGIFPIDLPEYLIKALLPVHVFRFVPHHSGLDHAFELCVVCNAT